MNKKTKQRCLLLPALCSLLLASCTAPYVYHETATTRPVVSAPPVRVIHTPPPRPVHPPRYATYAPRPQHVYHSVHHRTKPTYHAPPARHTSHCSTPPRKQHITQKGYHKPHPVRSQCKAPARPPVHPAKPHRVVSHKPTHHRPKTQPCHSSHKPKPHRQDQLRHKPAHKPAPPAASHAAHSRFSLDRSSSNRRSIHARPPQPAQPHSRKPSAQPSQKKQRQSNGRLNSRTVATPLSQAPYLS
ncbi:hypothetical protein [Rubritalea tangerina]|uniref:hypothetical protein n=1 Tax=Rubritalea tangerina TaxID=430798 RepID=UPI00360F7AED